MQLTLICSFTVYLISVAYLKYVHILENVVNYLHD